MRSWFRGWAVRLGGVGLVAVAAGVVVSLASTGTSAASRDAHGGAGQLVARGHHLDPGNDGLGIRPGKIKHVWLIILENKSYDATFTGLNNNTYLWQTLPAQGVLLKNYYGTGHFSLDNYISMVSGQATQPDTQADCPYYDHVLAAPSTRRARCATNPNYGQVASAAGPNAAAGSNGCVYPARRCRPCSTSSIAARVSWKGYAQDLNSPDPGRPTHSAGTQYCGAPFATPGATGSTTQAEPGSANATDQYVPKHFPFPWFESMLQSGDCNPAHIADVFDASNGLYHDLQSAAPRPHSAGSRRTTAATRTTPSATATTSRAASRTRTRRAPRRRTTPAACTRPTCSCQHVIPEIEKSPAFKDGGLIDITFDEAFPPFTYTGNSFANSTLVAPERRHLDRERHGRRDDSYGHARALRADQARTRRSPTDASGNQLYPGPGDNAFVDRPAAVSPRRHRPSPRARASLGGGSHVPGARTDTARSRRIGVSPRSTTTRSWPPTPGAPVTGDRRPGRAHSSARSPTPRLRPAHRAERRARPTPACSRSSTRTGAVLTTTGRGERGHARCRARRRTDPLYDATDPTNGGGDTGSVLISPFIRPGTVSKRATTTTTAGCARWRTCSASTASAGWTDRATSGTPPSPAWRRSVATCSTTRQVKAPSA